MKESNAATQAGVVDIDNGLILLVQLVFLWLLCTLQATSKYSKLVQEDRMITIEDGRKSRQENKSLKAKMCAKRTGIQPSICRSRSHLVGWHLQAPEMFADHGCRQFSRDKVYQLAADSNSSNLCQRNHPHSIYSNYTERYTASNQWVRINSHKSPHLGEVCGDVFRGCLQLFHHCGWCRWRLGRFWNWSPVPLRCLGLVKEHRCVILKYVEARKSPGKWKCEIR